MPDLTPFGFTPTEGLVYEVLLKGGPGTGYAIARSAGLARANAYGALEGLVTKGAARVEVGRPRRYRPEPPASLMARISSQHGAALDQLHRELDALAAPATPAVVEVSSSRAALQLLQHDIARADDSVTLLAPAEAFPLLVPTFRRPASRGVVLRLFSVGAVASPALDVTEVPAPDAWPGVPLCCVVDSRSALVASRSGTEVMGHWSSAPTIIAAARLTIDALTRTA